MTRLNPRTQAHPWPGVRSCAGRRTGRVGVPSPSWPRTRHHRTGSNRPSRVSRRRFRASKPRRSARSPGLADRDDPSFALLRRATITGVFDSRPGHGTPIDRERLLTLSYLSRGRTRSNVTEGRHHPETGRPFKTVATEVGETTEHATADDRVDAVAYVDTIRAVRDPDTGRITNV